MSFMALIPVCALPTSTPDINGSEESSLFIYAILLIVFFLLGFILGYAFKYKTGCRKKRKYNYTT